ncbi:hypothetical protein HF086_012608, partial [Spodoptera exigua]
SENGRLVVPYIICTFYFLPSVKNGTPHYFRVPRVILISRQFVLSTAIDAAQIPEGYALYYEWHLEDDDDEIKLVKYPKRLFSGNVIFGDYERDEVECRVSIDDIAAGTECEPAILLMPIADVLLHPEYKHFGAKYSNATKMTQNRMTCTTGCGFHSGAPTLVHEHTGHWSIVALSHGGSPCPDPLRVRRPPAPPHHIMIHPYVPWITAAITGKAVGAFAKDDPFGFIMPRASIYDFIAHGWVGHWWMGGLRCYDRGEAAEDLFKFYHEIFQINPIDAAKGTLIVCVKVGMPYQLGQPRVWELDSPIVKVWFLFSQRNIYIR